MALISAATLLIVTWTIGGIAVGRWPLLRANRATITLLGSTLLLGIGALTPPEAFATLDLNTLLLWSRAAWRRAG